MFNEGLWSHTVNSQCKWKRTKYFFDHPAPIVPKTQIEIDKNYSFIICTFNI